MILPVIVLIDKVSSELSYDKLNIRVESSHLFPDNLIIYLQYIQPFQTASPPSQWEEPSAGLIVYSLRLLKVQAS